MTDAVNLTPTNIVFSLNGNVLDLSWAADHIGWTLQTNGVSLLSTNSWFAYPNSAATNHVFITIDPTRSSLYFRLIAP